MLTPKQGTDLTRVDVDLGISSYPVLIGEGARHRLAGLLPAKTQKVAVVTQDAIPWSLDLDLEHEVFVLPASERAKTLSEVEVLCRHFTRMGLTRADTVVGIGGGVVTDVAGFAASIYHRGVAVIHVATTLLAQVDAAIGGKCGVNLPEGKNLIGSFWQPRAVLCDTETLSTLSPREWTSGRGEMAKYAFLGVDDLTGLDLQEQVSQCVRKKASVVASDEHEMGDRAHLNYGHTLAHALEAQALELGDDLRHGEAVAIGLHFAARLAVALDRVDPKRITDHLAVIQAMGLPMELPPYDLDQLVMLMSRDKKAFDGLTFVLDSPHGVGVVGGIDAGIVRRTLQEMREAS